MNIRWKWRGGQTIALGNEQPHMPVFEVMAI